MLRHFPNDDIMNKKSGWLYDVKLDSFLALRDQVVTPVRASCVFSKRV